MTLRRRDALILGGVAATAAAAGFLARPILLELGGGGRDALRDATFEDLAGKPRSLADWHAKILVLNFWATWCPPCLEEIPMLVAVRDRYASFGVEFVGIAVDLPAKVVEFSKNVSITYLLVVADAGALDLLRKLGNTAGGLPYTVFLDRDRVLVKRKLGILKRPELEAALAELLRK